MFPLKAVVQTSQGWSTQPMAGELVAQLSRAVCSAHSTAEKEEVPAQRQFAQDHSRRPRGDELEPTQAGLFLLFMGGVKTHNQGMMYFVVVN